MTHVLDQSGRSIFGCQGIVRIGVTLVFLAGLASSPAPSQSTIHAPNSITGTYSVHTGRPLADLLLQLQQAFVSPIDYEEIAYESPLELKSEEIVTISGPKKSLLTPITDFSATLTSEDSTPYLAVHSAISQYKAADLYGANGYRVVQQVNRIDVIPYQVLGGNGSWHQVTPVMTRPITFPQAERTIEATLGEIARQLSLASGKKVILLTQPFRLGEKVALSANKEFPGDLIARIGENLGTSLSFQCLYDASDSAYYLNVYPVAAAVSGSFVNNRAPGVNQPIPPLTFH